MPKNTQKKRERKPRRVGLIGQLVNHIRRDKKAFTVFVVLRALVIAVLVRSVFIQQWENVFVCVLTLVLLLIPPIVERSLHIDLPTTLEILVFCFVFCAEILGEIECYYIRFAFWDTALHTINGFMFAAFGFCLVDVLNENKRFRFELSPIYLAVVAFCFSMTIGVLWEFFEFSADLFLHTDMQKDTVLTRFASTALDATYSNHAVQVRDIVRTTIETADGETIVMPGYLDVGLVDTIKDMMVNFVGAVVFSTIGFFYVKYRGKGRIASQFIPIPDPEPEHGKDENRREEKG